MTDVVVDPYAEEPQESPVKNRRMFTPFGVAVILIAALMIGVVAWGIYQKSLSQPESGEAPDFTLPYIGQEGTFTLSDYRGQVVVINFWGSWCEPCKLEAPMLERTYQVYKDLGVLFVGVAVKDIERDSLAYIAEFGITYPNVMDRGAEVEDAYRTQGVPETFVVDKEGNITKFFYAQPRETDLYQTIEEALQS